MISYIKSPEIKAVQEDSPIPQFLHKKLKLFAVSTASRRNFGTFVAGATSRTDGSFRSLFVPIIQVRKCHYYPSKNTKTFLKNQL